MLSKKMEDAINRQINRELFSEYLYLGMAAYFESVDLPGFSNWMKIQAQEEHAHAMKFYEHVVDRSGRVKLLDVEAPPFEWKSPLDVFTVAYKHEQVVTGLINNLMEVAITEKDHASQNMLQWFIAEQVEEEANASAIMNQLKRIGKEGGGLYMLDKELATRVFVPIAPTQQ